MSIEKYYDDKGKIKIRGTRKHLIRIPNWLGNILFYGIWLLVVLLLSFLNNKLIIFILKLMKNEINRYIINVVILIIDMLEILLIRMIACPIIKKVA